MAAAWIGGWRWRLVLLPVSLLILSVLVLTLSKAAYLALGSSVLVVWWWQRWPWRLPATLLVGTLLLLLSLPSPPLMHLSEHQHPGLAARAWWHLMHLHQAVRDGLSDSAQVRIGYWDAALALVRSHPFAGVGLHGYSALAAAQLPVWAGYATQVHSEPLQAAVEGGLAAGLALLALLTWLPLRPAAAIGRDPGRRLPWRGRG